MYVLDHALCWQNLLSYHRLLASFQGDVIENEQGIALHNGFSNPVFNPVFLNAGQDALDLCGGASSVWCDSRLHSSALMETLQQDYQSVLSPVPMMAMHLNPIKNTTGDHDIRVWENPQDLSAWRIPIKIAFNLSDEDSSRYAQLCESAHHNLIHFAAYIDEQLAGVASLYTGDEYAGFYNLAVLPDYRRRGIATELHLARMKAALDLGFQVMTLQATPMASQLDQSLGMHVLSTLSIYYNE